MNQPPAISPPPEAAHPVSPSEIDEAIAGRAAELADDSLAANTRRSYAAAINYVVAWWYARYRQRFPLPEHPVPVAAIVTFIVDHSVIEGGRIYMNTQPSTAWIDATLVASGVKRKPGPIKWATFKHRLDVLSAAHTRLRHVDPVADPDVKKVLAGMRKSLDRAGLVRKRKATPLSQAAMAALLATCDDSPVGARDRALLLFGWPRRRSEIANARLDHLVRRVDPQTHQVSFVFALTDSKTQDAGADAIPIPIGGTAANALDEWIGLLETYGISATSGPLFRRAWQKGKRWVIGDRPLSADTIVRIIRQRATAAGLAPPSGRSFSGHSLRRGFVSEGLEKLPVHAVMAMTAQKTVRMVLEEYAEIEATRNPGARLFDIEQKRGS